MLWKLYSLLSTIDKLVLVGPLKTLLYSLILPEYFCVFIEFLLRKKLIL